MLPSKVSIHRSCHIRLLSFRDTCETSNSDSLIHPASLLNLMLRTHFQSILLISLLANTVACLLPHWDGLLQDQEHDLSPFSTPQGVYILELLEKHWTRRWSPNCLVCSVIRYLKTPIACQVHLTCPSRISWKPLRVFLEVRSLKMSLDRTEDLSLSESKWACRIPRIFVFLPLPPLVHLSPISSCTMWDLGHNHCHSQSHHDGHNELPLVFIILSS